MSHGFPNTFRIFKKIKKVKTILEPIEYWSSSGAEIQDLKAKLDPLPAFV